MSEKPEALRLAEELEALNGAKRDYGGIGGQMLGCEQYRLVASGSSFAALPNSADALLRQHAEIERLTADNERLREALDRSLTDEQIKQIAATIDRSMPLESAKILFARRIEAALRREDV